MIVVVAGLGLVLTASNLWALQRHQGPSRDPQARPQHHRRAGPPRDRAARALLLRVGKLPPAQQQQALENDEVFRQMPLQVQRHIRQQLAEFSKLPAGQRQAMLERLARGGGLGPPQALFLRVAPLSPEEREGVLKNDEFFQALPPRVQQRFRRRLEEFKRQSPRQQQRTLRRLQRFAELAPADQQKLRHRARRFAEMSPAQRERARHVFRAWQQLPANRRQLLVERLRRLQQSSPQGRQALLEDREFLAPLSEEERGLLRQLWRLRQVLPAPEVSPEP